MRMIQGFERIGLVMAIAVSGSDRRRRDPKLTPHGRTTLQAAADDLRAALATPDERERGVLLELAGLGGREELRGVQGTALSDCRSGAGYQLALPHLTPTTPRALPIASAQCRPRLPMPARGIGVRVESRSPTARRLRARNSRRVDPPPQSATMRIDNGVEGAPRHHALPTASGLGCPRGCPRWRRGS